MLRGEKGITLVALIITIIVLIILAAVTVMSISQYGMVDKAINAAETYEQEQNREASMVSEHDEKINSLQSRIDELKGGSTNSSSSDNV